MAPAKLAKAKAAPANGKDSIPTPSDTPGTPKKTSTKKKAAKKEKQTQAAATEGGTGASGAGGKAQLASSRNFSVPAVALYAVSLFAATQPAQSFVKPS